MRRVLLIAAALLLAVAAAAWLAPASLVSLAVTRATHGAAVLAGAEGTLWHGRGTLVANGAQLPLGWTTEASPLLRGRLRIRLEPPEGSVDAPRGLIELGANDVMLADTRIAFPAAMLAANPRAFIRPSGEITLTSQALAWQPPSASGNAGLVWRNAQLVIGGAALGLGTVSATLSAAGDAMTGPIVNEGGEVDVGGNVTLTAPAAIEIALTVRPRAGTPSLLLKTLAAIATPDNGGWRLHWRGTLR